MVNKMDTLFYVMAEYLQDIGKSGRKTLLDSGVIQRVSDLDGNFVIIDVYRCIGYMTANIDGCHTVWCEGDELYCVHDVNDHSDNLIGICNFEEFMLSFIPWYHAKLFPATTKSLDAPIIKEVPKSLTTIPFLGI